MPWHLQSTCNACKCPDRSLLGLPAAGSTAADTQLIQPAAGAWKACGCSLPPVQTHWRAKLCRRHRQQHVIGLQPDAVLPGLSTLPTSTAALRTCSRKENLVSSSEKSLSSRMAPSGLICKQFARLRRRPPGAAAVIQTVMCAVCSAATLQQGAIMATTSSTCLDGGQAGWQLAMGVLGGS